MAEPTTTLTQPTKRQELNQYEAMFLLPPASGQDLEAGLNLVRSFIERHAGQVMVLKRWDERKLAYEINKHKRGLYLIAYFRAPGDAVGQIERDVKLSDAVLRVMITRADHLNQEEMEKVEPQPIVPREERNPWDRPYGGGGGGGWGGGDRGDRGDRGPRDDRGGDRGGGGDRGPREERPPVGPGAGAGTAGGGDRPPRGPRRGGGGGGDEAGGDAGANKS